MGVTVTAPTWRQILSRLTDLEQLAPGEAGWGKAIGQIKDLLVPDTDT